LGAGVSADGILWASAASIWVRIVAVVGIRRIRHIFAHYALWESTTTP
jgi:hypothetical protein